MKVAYCSDLHLEFRDLQVEIVDADVLVLAGDITLIKLLVNELKNKYNENGYLIDFIDTVTHSYKHVIWIMGNHEYYSGGLEDIQELRSALASYVNLHILENESIIIDDVKFICGTMWTDLNNYDPITAFQSHRLLNDFSQITDNGARFTSDTWLNLHSNFTKFLANEVTDKCVIITHHSPTFATIHENYRDSKIINGLYASRLENFIIDNKIKYWIHGHLHDAHDEMIGECAVISNTRGYPREECFKTFKIKVIDVFN